MRGSSRRPRPARWRWTALSVSTLTAVALGIWSWDTFAPRGTVVMVEHGADYERMQLERAREVAAAGLAGAAPAAAPAVAVPAGAPTAGPPLPPAIPRERAEVLWPQPRLNPERFVHDELAGFWPRPDISGPRVFAEHPAGRWPVATNDLGFRSDRPVAVERPDLRVLVTGDSHTSGLVPAAEAFCALLERDLRAAHPARSVEVLNGGIGGYSFANYLGVLRKWQHLRPHVFVVVVYGGNDFLEAEPVHRYRHGLQPVPALRPDQRERFDAYRRARPGLFAQFACQAMRMVFTPPLQARALDAARENIELARRCCAAAGIRLVVAYLPSVAETHPRSIASELADLRAALQADGDPEQVAAALRERCLQGVAELGVAHVDLTAPLAALATPPYWRSDCHLDTAGHRVVAAELLKVVGAGD